LTRVDKILLGKNKGKIEVWNFNGDIPERVIQTREKNIHCIELDRRQQIIYVGGSGGKVLAYDYKTGKIKDKLTIEIKKSSIFALALSKDEKRIAVGKKDPYIEVWDLNTQKCIQTFFQVYPTPNKSLLFADKDQNLISRSSGNIVYSWIMDVSNQCKIIDRGAMKNDNSLQFCHREDKEIRRIIALQEFHFGNVIGVRNNCTKIRWENKKIIDRNSDLRKDYHWSKTEDALQLGSFEKDGRFIALNQEGKIEILDFNPEWFNS
jgi:WD40 repeat protein